MAPRRFACQECGASSLSLLVCLGRLPKSLQLRVSPRRKPCVCKKSSRASFFFFFQRYRCCEENRLTDISKLCFIFCSVALIPFPTTIWHLFFSLSFFYIPFANIELIWCSSLLNSASCFAQRGSVDITRESLAFFSWAHIFWKPFYFFVDGSRKPVGLNPLSICRSELFRDTFLFQRDNAINVMCVVKTRKEKVA